MTPRRALALAVPLLAVAALAQGASAQIDLKDLSVKATGVRSTPLEGSDLFRVNLEVTNSGNDEITLVGDNFELLDSELRRYGAASGFDLMDRGVSWLDCGLILEEINPGISVDIQVCFQVPESNFQYDSVIVYKNSFTKSIRGAMVVPLIEDSVGISTLIRGDDRGDPELADRAEELASRTDLDDLEDLEGLGGCLIATAAHGTELSDEVQNLREVRNRAYGTWLGGAMHAVNEAYYSFSPAVADWQRENDLLMHAVRLFITPAVASFAAIDHSEMAGEAEFVSYVAGMSALNAGLYVALPAASAYAVRRGIRGRR